MALEKVLAKDWIFEINTGDATTAIWEPIGGVKSFSYEADKTDADLTDFDSDGNTEHVPVRRSASLTVEGHVLEDPADGTRDPGQEAVEAAALAVGPGAIREFQITSPGGTVKTFNASAKVGGPGGGNDDDTDWSVELTITGAIV